ncbi:hypothetical protein C2U32_04145 [Acinetobacter baumannii]|nr:hypothetical protein C2U32_04145 [Acinetobacter baumannii]
MYIFMATFIGLIMNSKCQQTLVKSDLYIKGQEKKIVFLFSKVIIDYVQTGLYILVWDDNLKKCQTLS